MNEKNKKSWLFDIKCIALLFWGLLTAVALAGVLNFCENTLVKTVVAVVAVCNVFVAVRFGRRLMKDE